MFSKNDCLGYREYLSSHGDEPDTTVAPLPPPPSQAAISSKDSAVRFQTWYQFEWDKQELANNEVVVAASGASELSLIKWKTRING